MKDEWIMSERKRVILKWQKAEKSRIVCARSNGSVELGPHHRRIRNASKAYNSRAKAAYRNERKKRKGMKAYGSYCSEKEKVKESEYRCFCAKGNLCVTIPHVLLVLCLVCDS